MSTRTIACHRDHLLSTPAASQVTQRHNPSRDAAKRCTIADQLDAAFNSDQEAWVFLAQKKNELRAQAHGSDTEVDHTLQEAIWQAIGEMGEGFRKDAIKALSTFWWLVCCTPEDGLGWLVAALCQPRGRHRRQCPRGSCFVQVSPSRYHVAMRTANTEAIWAYVKEQPSFERTSWLTFERALIWGCIRHQAWSPELIAAMIRSAGCYFGMKLALHAVVRGFPSAEVVRCNAYEHRQQMLERVYIMNQFFDKTGKVAAQFQGKNIKMVVTDYTSIEVRHKPHTITPARPLICCIPKPNCRIDKSA